MRREDGLRDRLARGVQKRFKIEEIKSSISTLEFAWEQKSLRPSWLSGIWFCYQVAQTNKLELLKGYERRKSVSGL